MKKKKEENVWRRKIFGKGKYLVHGGKKDQGRKRRTILGEGKYLAKENIWSTEEKKNGEGKYLEKENIWSAQEMNNGEGKGGNYLEKEN